MKYLIIGVCLVGFGCATTPIPLSNNSVDVNEINDRWSLHVVTNDEDGAERVTRIWIAMLDGDPTIRTNESRWWANIERDPQLRIRLSGIDHPFRVTPTSKPETRAMIDDVFLEKYGGWERLLFPQERGETHDDYGILRR